MKKLNLVIFLSLILLSGCASRQTHSTLANCIPPSVTLAYPVNLRQDELPIAPKIPPLEPWEQIQMDSPENYPTTGYYAQSIVVGPDGRIWMLTPVGIVIYSFLSGETQYIPTFEGNSINDGFLFTSQDGTIWLVNPRGFFPDTETGVLARYSEISREFEMISDNQHLTEGSHLWALTVDEDSSGNLWLILDGNIPRGVYQYDPLTNDSIYYGFSGEYSTVSSLAVAPDDRIWFYESGENLLIIFDPETGELEELNSISTEITNEYTNSGHLRMDATPDLYFDSSGRLWIDDYGWVDINNDTGEYIWYRIIRSSVFISRSFNYYESSYGWTRPYRIFESSNGIFWFTSSAGSVSLDPLTGEWCLFTTGRSPIVEDQSGNLWMTAYGALYRYQLNP